MRDAMNSTTVIMIVALAAMLPGAGASAQGADGVPGDRLVVPLPDVSGLEPEAAQELTRELAQMNVISAECPEFEVSDPEWQLLNGTTDALMAQLGLDAVAYDREYFRPAFSVLDDPQACERLGPQLPQMIDRLVEMGGDTRPVLPEELRPQAGAAGAADLAAPDADTDVPETQPGDTPPAN
jgi:hypothetical protein